MTVRYFTSPNDANHRNKHAIVNEDKTIEFFAFPYQEYSARKGRTSASVNSFIGIPEGRIWVANIWDCLPNGKSDPICSKSFSDKDEAFEFAYRKISEKEQKWMTNF